LETFKAILKLAFYKTKKLPRNLPIASAALAKAPKLFSVAFSVPSATLTAP